METTESGNTVKEVEEQPKHELLRRYFETRTDEEKVAAVIVNAIICICDPRRSEFEDIAQRALWRWRCEVRDGICKLEDPRAVYAAGVACGLNNG